MTSFPRLPRFVVPAVVACLMVGLVASAALAAAPAKLAIVKAEYGDLPAGGKVDVTEKVKGLVKDNALSVEATNDNFTDPADGIGKKLKVDFTLDGTAQSRTVNENETLAILSGEVPITIVIVKAEYGDLPSGGKVDVTEKVKGMAKDGALLVAATNENFTDPAEGTGKTLRVECTINGKAVTKSAAEGETLTLTSADLPMVGKLVVVKAVYGDLPDGGKVDVTEKVKGMVKDNALSVDATNENFTDPADGIGKKLTVEYTIDGMIQSKTVGENENLAISGNAPAAGGKLAIVKAEYGDLPSGGKVDVTEKVKGMVKDGALSVEATNDNFTDPAEGIGKKLKVDYTFGGAAKSKTADENETLRISANGD